MAFRIIWEEGKKLFLSPIIWVLIIVFIAFNGIIISSNGYLREEIRAISTIGEKFGYEVNEKLIRNLEIEERKNLIKINEISRKFFNKGNYNSTMEFLQSENGQDLFNNKEKLGKENYRFLIYATVIENYRELIGTTEEDYNKVNLIDYGKAIVEDYGLKEEAARIVRKNYDLLEKRFNEIKKTGEQKNLFFYGKSYLMHSFLFKKIIKYVLFEETIITVLITSFLVNYERDNRNNLLVESTKRGRKNSVDKLFTSIIGVLITSFIIIGITLFIYFMFFNYGGLWQSSISSMFNWEENLPNISWFRLSFRSYLMLTIIFILLVAIIISIISFSISMISKSSYKTIFLFFILFGVIYALPAIIPKSSQFIIWSHFNIFTLIMKSGKWFIGGNPFVSFKYYEIITVISSSFIASIIALFSYKKYKREDLV